MTDFPAEWRNWIDENRARGCSLDEIGRILVSNGFSYDLVERETGIDFSGNVELALKDQSIVAQSMEILHYWLRDDWQDFPHAKEHKGRAMTVYTIDDFLTTQECAALMEDILADNVPSRVTREVEDADFRTSSSANLNQAPSSLVNEVDARIASYIGIHNNYAEFVQGQLYDVGQQFKLHPDYFDDLDFADHCLHQGQRTWTFMVYLNTPTAGGETEFPEADISITPKTGMGVFWNNLDSLGVRNRSAMHRGLPVKAGQKAILTKWFRQFPLVEPVTAVADDLEAPLSQLGWTVKANALRNQPDDNVSVEIARLTDQWIEEGAQVSDVSISIEPAQNVAEFVEKLSRYRLSAIYGGEEMNDQLLLRIRDHRHKWHEVVIRPGDVLIVEGSRVLCEVSGASALKINQWRVAGLQLS